MSFEKNTKTAANQASRCYQGFSLFNSHKRMRRERWLILKIIRALFVFALTSTVAFGLRIAIVVSSEGPRPNLIDPFHYTIKQEMHSMGNSESNEIRTPLRSDGGRSTADHHPRVWISDSVGHHKKHSKGHVSSRKHRRHVLDMHEHRSNNVQVSQPDKPYTNQSMCVPMNDWQVTPRPNCNIVHEIDLRSGKFLGSGGWRSAWKIPKSVSSIPAFSWGAMDEFIVKTVKLESRLFSKYVYDRHFTDATISDQLTHSPHVVDIYGYCAQTALNQLAKGKLSSIISHRKKENKALSLLEKLDYATQVALSVADLHSIDGERYASAVHKDLKPANIVLSEDGRLLLTDFNDAELILWNTTSKSPCGFRRKRYKANYRSPEEIRTLPLTDSVDLYSVGGIIYFLLTGKKPFSDMKDRDAAVSIGMGKHPQLPSTVLDSNDRAIKSLVTAMQKCFMYDPRKRPTARAVADSLKKELEKLTASK